MSPQPLPQAVDELATGAYNGTIFIIGGYGWRGSDQQLTTYEIATDTLTDFGSVLPGSISGGYGQFWTQVDHIIYMIKLNIIYTYNLITNEYTNNWKSITLNPAVSYTGCIASDSGYLYITGGDESYDSPTATSTDELQILRLSTYQWLNNAPPMTQNRSYHGCIAYNEYVWVFGGTLYERISTIDIINNTWTSFDALTMSLGPRAAAWLDTIYVIGGNTRVTHLVNATTAAVTSLPHIYPLKNSLGAPVVVDAVLYVFGGFQNEGVTTADWAYYPLPLAPTSKPTALPTFNPSQFPSNEPSASPSKEPKQSTEMPSNRPLFVDILNPTHVQHQSLYPTLASTVITSQTFMKTIGSDIGKGDVDIVAYISVSLIIVLATAIAFLLCKYFKKRSVAKEQQTMMEIETQKHVPHPNNIANDAASAPTNDVTAGGDDNVVEAEEEHENVNEFATMVSDTALVQSMVMDDIMVEMNDGAEGVGSYSRDAFHVTKGDEDVLSDEAMNTQGGEYDIAGDEFVVVGEDENNVNTATKR
eukprot:125532_1